MRAKTAIPWQPPLGSLLSQVPLAAKAAIVVVPGRQAELGK
jgi:hypothetical protein